MFIQDMLRTHPRTRQDDSNGLSACIEACFECAQACTACADACLSEAQVKMLVRCVRLNLDCADICAVTGRLLSRQTEANQQLLHHQVQACVTACRVCGDECAQHAQHHEHCRVCAEACRRCEEACKDLLGTVVM